MTPNKRKKVYILDFIKILCLFILQNFKALNDDLKESNNLI